MANRPVAKSKRGEPNRAGPERRPGAGRAARVRAPGPLFYKVVEISTVDEGTLEHTVNHWVSQGWNLDGVQFAMRESSKRPSMAFVFFTRDDLQEAPHDPHAAREHLRRLAEGGEEMGPPREADPWKRLAQLAGEDEPS